MEGKKNSLSQPKKPNSLSEYNTRIFFLFGFGLIIIKIREFNFNMYSFKVVTMEKEHGKQIICNWNDQIYIILKLYD